YINGDLTYKGATILVSDGVTKSDVDIYGGVLALRHDTGSSITNANIQTGWVDDYTDMMATTSGTTNITATSSADIHVWTGDTYAPGGTVTTQGTGDLHLDDTSTVTLGTATNVIADDIIVDTGATLNINASTNVNGGSIITAGTATVTNTAGTPTVTISGTGTLGGGSNALTFDNLTISSTGVVTGSTSFSIGGCEGLIINTSGSLILSGGTVTLPSGCPYIENSGTLTFYNLTIASGSTPQTYLTNVGFSVANTLTIESTAVYQPQINQPITMTGGSIVNSGTLRFDDLIIAGNVSSGSSFTVVDDLTITSGTLTTSGGTIIVEDDLVVSGTITGTGDMIVEGGDVSGSGTINLTSGTFTNKDSTSFGSNSGWTFNKLNFGSTTNSVSSYDNTNKNGTLSMEDDANDYTAIAQSFTSTGGTLDSVKFYLQRGGGVSGNIVAKLYAHSGTFGTNSVPTGAALATSETVSATSLVVGESRFYNFEFTAGNRYAMTNGTNYVISVEHTPAAGSNISGGDDSTSPTHPGNTSAYNGTWSALSYDLVFNVYADGVVSTTTSTGTGSVTTATTTIANNQIMDAGVSKTWSLTASHEPFQMLGTFLASSSTFKYTGTNNATVTPTTYYNLEISPSSGSPTVKLATTTGQTITVNNDFTINGSGAATVDANTRDPVLDVNGNFSIGDGDTFQASNSSAFTLAGNYTDSNISASGFTHNSGTLTLDSSNTATISSVKNTTFYNMTSIIPGKTIKFSEHESGTPDVPLFTFANLFTVTGASSNWINIQSDAPGWQWLVNFNIAQTAITYASVRDSACNVGSLSVAYSATNSSGGNNGSCWNMGNIGASGDGTVTSVEMGSGGGTVRIGGGSDSGGGSVEGGSGGGAPQGGGGQGGGGGGSP
ncbi:MAG: hypothetical protein AAB392_00700, partial [Patescibacteria group bacterium]